MKDKMESCRARLALRIQNAGAGVNPEILQLPGGSVIAALLWLYTKGTIALQRH
jgi:hypothetical protein